MQTEADLEVRRGIGSGPSPGSGGDRFLETLVRGRGIKADLFVVSRNGRRIVVKDYRRRGALGRWIGRLQVRREERVYRRLQGLEGVPEFLGVRNGIALEVVHVPGLPIDRYQYQDGKFVERVLDRLRGLINAIHGRGVAHVDLRRRNNVLVDRHGRVHMIDFAGSFYFPAGSWTGRWIFPWLKKVDESAFLKWKHRLAPASLSPVERSRLRRIGFLRGFWFINRPGSHTS